VPGGTANAAGEVISYVITVQNTGNATLTGVAVTDPYADPGSIVRGPAVVGDNDGLLETGETWNPRLPPAAPKARPAAPKARQTPAGMIHGTRTWGPPGTGSRSALRLPRTGGTQPCDSVNAPGTAVTVMGNGQARSPST
jgi:hypothetical protein